MAVFDPKSRYVRYARTVEITDARGRTVLALTPAEPPPEDELGEHRLDDGQRLDHLASFYLDDPSGYWRICELNDALLPDALAEVELVKIPTRRG